MRKKPSISHDLNPQSIGYSHYLALLKRLELRARTVMAQNTSNVATSNGGQHSPEVEKFNAATPLFLVQITSLTLLNFFLVHLGADAIKKF